MNTSGEAAEQVVRMTLNGVEVAAKISGKGAERLAVLIAAALRDSQKSRGHIRLANMLRSNKPLKVFSVQDKDLRLFCKEAKKYGVLYCVLKDRDASDGQTDIMVREEDASKINRIFERFNLFTVDVAAVERNPVREPDRDSSPPDVEQVPDKDAADETFVDELLQEHDKTREVFPAQNPSMARTVPSPQSAPTLQSSGNTDRERLEDAGQKKPSVCKEIEDIRNERKNAPKKGAGNQDLPRPEQRRQKPGRNR